MNLRTSDLAGFLAELRQVRHSTEGHQVAWERKIIAFENCLSVVDVEFDRDPDLSKKLEEIRAIIADKNRSVKRRLFACFVVLDMIKKLSDEKTRSMGAHSARQTSDP
jgi:hypothetical protein